MRMKRFSGFGDLQPGAPATPQVNAISWVDVIGKGLQTYEGYRQSREVNKLNIERIRAGQDPLTAEQKQAVQPGVTITHDIAADTKKDIAFGLGGGGVLLVGGIVAAFLMLERPRRGNDDYRGRNRR